MKTNKLGVLTVAGFAALFLGLAGSAHADPFSIRDTLGSGVHWGSQHHSESAFGRDRSDHSERLSGLIEAYPVGLHRGFEMKSIHDWKCSVFTSDEQAPSTTTQPVGVVSNVPEGGMTAALVGFALMGLAFTRKVLPV